MRLVALMLFSLPCASHAENALHHKIEAAYLYNFFNYITWPDYENPQALQQPIICLNGDDPVRPYLNYVQNKFSAERTLSIRVIREGENLNGCHLFFIRSGITSRLMSEALRNRTLLVSEPEDSLERDAMIELIQHDERLVMVIDQTLLSENNFQVSSRLLDLAQKIK